ncbi:hypothetical protein NEUTE1DRAFT_60095 [Neurospora tetrasperma FGSC 2508]|uniref:Protein ARV n=1 Tax=Neurospora tetrasperma (strain FGSC 2508 / ATCC MYA-4615 / P0657) TaxID=510951 RepID=F8MJ20_NEUT8|nr:uncharacterized protein NEUTE1DRAFT_60095 [Neurospora tetrasperma FGSC 2508]EGO59069.1 hypothetical protein NEUTE1DRAFT_60095 [Neurospora tetrasperma FGSC 2508]EGZ73173.1 hypothetical protein NEUTE2DRAFT_107425 [Neurospora tetrasperma FGSC 2509]
MSLSQRPPSSALLPASAEVDDNSLRPRNRRVASNRNNATSSSLCSSPSRTSDRGASPIPAARIGDVTGRNDSRLEVAAGSARTSSPRGGRGLLDGSWASTWASVQEFTTSLLTGGESYHTGSERLATQTAGKQKSSSSWGPEPPNESRPRLEDVGSGSLTEREGRLRALRTASVLESHEGVNGGLDVSRRFKKRNSDEDLREASQSQEAAEHLVYIHHVQPTDTYAGIVLRYKCREDAFRKANGLWSRDNIQIRKWLAIPVDACEIKGRPCEGPSFSGAQVDCLARTPEGTDPFGRDNSNNREFFGPSTNDQGRDDKLPTNDDERPWTHVRWVSLDSFPNPVEVARVERKVLGYFPPRRRKSINTTSTMTSPRTSMDVPGTTLSGETGPMSPGSISSRRTSLMGSRPSLVGDDARPAWMRRPGGVGSLRNVRAPGPEKDYFNTWTNKHLPGLNIDSLPSMAVLGAETARLGFHGAEEHPTIVESPFEDGGDASRLNGQGSTGLDKAAAAVENWLRGAFVKRPLGTPSLGVPKRSPLGAEEGDLIELTDTNSDDDRGGTVNPTSNNLQDTGLSNFEVGTSGRSATMGGTSSLLNLAVRMPICIECRHPVKTLWREGAGDKSTGHNIRLTVCKNCGRFCDKYVEHDFVVLFIDLVLIKPQVYRHLLHNTLMKDEDEFAYMFFLLLCTLSTLAFHGSIRFLTSSRYSPLHLLGILPQFSRPNSVSTALLVSSSTKLFPILMVIWEYDVPAAARSLGWAVVANNVEALKILLDCNYGVATLLATAGALSRWAMGRAILWAAGLDGVDSVGEHSVAEEGRVLGSLLMYAKDWLGRLAVG